MPNEDSKKNDYLHYYGELVKACQNQDYEKSLKIASRILHEWTQDETALTTKIICLIHLNRFEDAIKIFNDNKKDTQNMYYEKAYCYYRLQKIEQAKEVLENVKENSFRKKELLSQIYYRLDQYEEAYQMMKDLIKNSDDELDDERETNLSAINAALQQHGVQKPGSEVMGETYEMRYNFACGLIAQGKIREAEILLSKVEKQALETLQEDGASEQDIADEVGLVVAQRAYCAQVEGRTKEAMGLYSRILKDKPSDVGLVAVTSNNIVCINKDQNIFDSKKRIKNLTADGVSPRLNGLQRRDLLVNQCLFYLHTQQGDLCNEMCSQLEEKFPEAEEEAMLIKVALVAKTQGLTETKKVVASLVKQNPESAITIRLGLVQQALREGQRDVAISLLKDLGKDYYRPGVISALVTMYQSDGKTAEAAKVLKEAVEFYRKSGGNKENMNLLWRQTASLMMQQGEPAEAAKSLEELRRNAPNDPVTLAQLIVAYAQYDIIKAKSLSDKLPALGKPDVDIGVLESPNWLSNMKFTRKAAKGDSAAATPVDSKLTGEKDKVKKKKKKKAKLPANYDPDRKPDPERWLPRFERSGYRPKKTRKGRVDVGKGTQGADSVASAIYDMSGKVGQRGQQDESPAQTAVWRKDAHKKKKRRK